MKEPWSQSAWRRIESVFKNITVHPFLTGLIDGSLERDKFLFYIRQDAIYLDDFAKAMAGVAVKTPRHEHTETFLRLAGDTIGAELELHQSFLGQLDFQARPSPSCLLYISYIHRQLALAPLEVAAAAILPCMWVYKEVGDFILAAQRRADNPYQSWIDTYSGEDFAVATAQAIAATDELAAGTTEETRRQMTDSFELCAKMEWMFWDSAWRMEDWPI